MSKATTFWSALADGLACQGSIYGGRPDYQHLIPRRSVGDVFVEVGRNMSYATGTFRDEQRQRRARENATHSVAAE